MPSKGLMIGFIGGGSRAGNGQKKSTHIIRDLFETLQGNGLIVVLARSGKARGNRL
jgi:hypothetical protein